MQAIVPDIDENIPLPSSATEALPDLSPAAELEMRARTITFLAELTGKPLTPGEVGKAAAEELARRMMQDPHFRPNFALYPDETTAYLAGLVQKTRAAIVDDLADLKTYVINKLIQEVETTESGKIRISALKMLGEVDGVDVFKTRIEHSHKILPLEEVEKKLYTILEGVQYTVANGEIPPKQAENGEKTLFLGFDEAEIVDSDETELEAP